MDREGQHGPTTLTTQSHDLGNIRALASSYLRRMSFTVAAAVLLIMAEAFW